MVEDYNLIVHLRSHVGSINANAFGKFMLDGVPINADRTCAVRRERSGCSGRHTKVLKKPP
jgi:hypothetical protein